MNAFGRRISGGLTNFGRRVRQTEHQFGRRLSSTGREIGRQFDAQHVRAGLRKTINTMEKIDPIQRQIAAGAAFAMPALAPEIIGASAAFTGTTKLANAAYSAGYNKKSAQEGRGMGGLQLGRNGKRHGQAVVPAYGGERMRILPVYDADGGVMQPPRRYSKKMMERI